MAESLLDRDFLARLEYVYVVARGMFVDHLAAARTSKKFGIGHEFADHRSYTVGDDLRYIDWSAYARRGDLLIKLFSEDKASRFYIVVDASRSMATGSPEKLFYAKKIAATLAYIAMANLDVVTVMSFDERLQVASRSFQSKGQLQRLLAYLESIKPAGQSTRTGEAFEEFSRRFSSRGTVVLLSDFLDGPGYERAIGILRYYRHALVAIQVNDRSEVDPPFTGDLELIDSESRERIKVQITPDTQARYRQAREAHYAELGRLCKAIHAPRLEVVTDTPFDKLIFEVFRSGGFLA